MTKSGVHKLTAKGHLYMDVIFVIQFLFGAIGSLYSAGISGLKISVKKSLHCCQSVSVCAEMVTVQSFSNTC